MIDCFVISKAFLLNEYNLNKCSECKSNLNESIFFKIKKKLFIVSKKFSKIYEYAENNTVESTIVKYQN